MKTIAAILCLFLAIQVGLAENLTESTFTEVIQEVNILSTSGDAAPAKVSDLFKAPQRVRTGPQSRAELTAPDKTITRVGANTVFSFADNGRSINLEKGNLLFHAPKGLGGGTIRSGGASAAVLGTTIIVSATEKGGFKFIILEGKGTATLPNGHSVTLKAGQLVFILPGDRGFSKVMNINLSQLVKGAQLISGFGHQLSSLGLIELAINQQTKDLSKGRLNPSGLTVEQYIVQVFPGNGLNTLNGGSYQLAIPTPLTQDQINIITTDSGQTPLSGGSRNPQNFSPPPIIIANPPGFGRNNVIITGPVVPLG